RARDVRVGVPAATWGARPGITGTPSSGRIPLVRVVGGALPATTSPVCRGAAHPGPGSGRPLLSWAVFGAAEPFRGRERGGSGARKGRRRSGMPLSPLRTTPAWLLWVIEEGVVCDPGWLPAGTRHRFRRRGAQASPPGPPPRRARQRGHAAVLGAQAQTVNTAAAHSDRRRALEPRPRGAPHPARVPGPGPSFAVAARLNPGPVGRRARPGCL